MDSQLRWTNLTYKEVCAHFEAHSIKVSITVVIQLFLLHGFVRRKMYKNRTLKVVENRDQQFRIIAQKKEEFLSQGLPVLSIDTKKKEMLGNFYREGKCYCRERIEVNDHDFKSFAEGTVIPHGIYDLLNNKCYLTLGKSKDTAVFMSDNIQYHWNNSLKALYPKANKMLILCDGGGSNSSLHYVVKQQFKLLADRLNIEIVIAHYPAYCSKWNPIEHRAFCYISRAWEGVVFKDYLTIKQLAEKASTKTGFSVKVHINDNVYQTGIKASQEFIANMPVSFDHILPKWNYSFTPKQL